MDPWWSDRWSSSRVRMTGACKSHDTQILALCWLCNNFTQRLSHAEICGSRSVRNLTLFRTWITFPRSTFLFHKLQFLNISQIKPKLWPVSFQMAASFVMSEVAWIFYPHGVLWHAKHVFWLCHTAVCRVISGRHRNFPVSYTHLTLPTIYSV